MTDGEALLAAIIASPDDDTPRLVYADWLEENNQSKRAEFIRVQVELAALPQAPAHDVLRGGNDEAILRELMEWRKRWSATARKLRDRAQEILISFPAAKYLDVPASLTKTHPHRDVAPGQPVVRCHGYGVREVRLRFDRGFVAEVTSEAAEWLAHGDAIRSAHPVTRVTLTTQPDLQVLVPGVYSLPGENRWAATKLGDNEQWRDVALRLLHTEWPGVTFELLPATTMTNLPVTEVSIVHTPIPTIPQPPDVPLDGMAG